MTDGGGLSLVSHEQASAFARLSGDFNPLHISAVEARRTLFGQPIVHGLYLVFAVLNAAMSSSSRPANLQRVRASFHRSTPVGSEFVIRINEICKNEFVGFVETKQGAKSATIKVWLIDSVDVNSAPLIAREEWPVASPQTFDPATSTRSGNVPLRLQDELLRSLFPSMRALPVTQLATLLASTQIVGMKCPGHHSIFSALDLNFSARGYPPELSYSVKSLNADFGLINLDLVGEGVRGSADAFLRPIPVTQPSIEDLRERTTTRDFVGRSVIVVGGTRGIGEVVAKLLALRGARVTVSYHRGKEEADRIVAEGELSGLEINAVRLDVTDVTALADFKDLLQRQDGIVYCATPPILPTANGFSRVMFDRYCDYYVIGMERMIQLALNGRSFAVTSPSTAFLDNPELGYVEYIASKAAAEALAQDFTSRYSNLRVSMPRLDRVLTDQTNSVQGGRFAEVVSVADQLILPLL